MTICPRAAGETPTLYFYGELDPAARNDFERHLATCAACAAAVGELEQVRAALDDRASVTRTDAEWADFMRRLGAATCDVRRATVRRATVPRADVSTSHVARRTWHVTWHVMTWFALAATLLVGVALGLVWQPRSLPPRQATVNGTAGDAALEAAAARHFERAKIVLLGLVMKDTERASAADWEYERALAASLLPETRLFRLSAADRGDARLARLLGDLETVLLQASMASDADPPELQRLQRIIRGRDLIVRMGFREL
ncbi:MAG: zf-HC2 domain-containing protein [Acidobacteria bacterium]|nr:zf-HC2 domain-containing protein [Acidobacteriota bacterium]